MTVTFDTLAVSRRLRDAEFSDIQAEALTSAIGTALAGGVATKADILSLEAEIVRLEGKIDTGLAELRESLRWIIRIGGAILVLVAYPVIRDLLTGAM